MQERIQLIRAKKEDAELLHRLQVEAFMPLYEKYQDDETSPAKESEERVLRRILDTNSEYYIIYNEHRSIGGIRVSHHSRDVVINNVAWISPLFIIPEYQNKGIAQLVLQRVFEQYPEVISWRLDTIKQEKGNCHLYEKLGFVRVGEDKIINDKMTLVDYQKVCVVSRRFEQEDAKKVCQLVKRNFLEVNSKDYGLKAMERLASVYDAEKICSTAAFAHMYVFEWDGEIIGVGAISSYWGSKTESILLTIFVVPEHHGKGIGRVIIHTLEQDELYTRASRVEIPASITGTEFYRKFGYDYKNGVKELDGEGHYRLEKFKEVG